ncbi:MAG: glycoside hydrolase family 44 protein [Oscillospiraceae bacterium]
MKHFHFKNRIIRPVCLAASAAILLTDAGIASDAAYNVAVSEGYSVTIDTSADKKPISRYIYGINDVYGLNDVTVYSVKQSDPRISSYNWETNTSNSTALDGMKNDLSLVKGYPPSERNEPALLTRQLVERSDKYGIPSRYVTLQMMGFVANDANGAISDDDPPKRFASVRCIKNDSLLTAPDVYDDTVFMDEYISALVYKYGTAADGGINGYFLDSEPENWSSLYPTVSPVPMTAEALVSKSVSLANAAKKIDPTALIYGPSIGGLEAFVSLKNQEDWEQYKSNYSWFIDFYLDKMSKASEQTGTRLLDVLDLHFISEARSVLLEPIVGTDSLLANEERMQAPRILWDPNYTENSSSAILYKQHTPLIPTIQASIRMYFPDTKLSFSEYNFGGGNHISGGIAEADVLGIFGEQNVYMACLKPDEEDFSYQKSAINIYTNYDGEGSSYGNTSVKTDNGGTKDNSVYASIDSDDESTLKAVFINKTSVEMPVDFTIASSYDFEKAAVYSFDSTHSDIRLSDDNISISDNSFTFTAAPLSVSLIEFKCEEIFDDPDDVDDDNDESEASVTKTQSSASANSEHEHVEVTAQTKQSIDDGADENVQTSISVVGTDDLGETITEIVTSVSKTEADKPAPETEPQTVPKAVKVIGIVLTAAVVAGIVFVLLDNGGDKNDKLPKKKE